MLIGKAILSIIRAISSGLAVCSEIIFFRSMLEAFYLTVCAEPIRESVHKMAVCLLLTAFGVINYEITCYGMDICATDTTNTTEPEV